MKKKPDWMIEEPLLPIKDTRSAKVKAREARIAKDYDMVCIPIHFPAGQTASGFKYGPTTGSMMVRRSDLEQ